METKTKVVMITIISSAIVALLLIVGLGSNIFTTSDNQVEEACESGIEAITGVQIDLSPWNSDPHDMNGMSSEESKVVSPEIIPALDPNFKEPDLEELTEEMMKKIVGWNDQDCSGASNRDTQWNGDETGPNYGHETGPTYGTDSGYGSSSGPRLSYTDYYSIGSGASDGSSNDRESRDSSNNDVHGVGDGSYYGPNLS